MSRTKKQVTLDDATITALEAEGRGSLSVGIENVYRDWVRGITPASIKVPHHAQTHTPPDDEHQAPRPHPATVAAEARRAEAEATRKATLYANHRKSMLDMLVTGKHPTWQQANMESYVEYGIPVEYSRQVVAELTRDDDGSLADAINVWEQERAAHERIEQAQKAKYRELVAAGMPSAQAVAEVTTGVAALPEQKLQLSIAALRGLGLFGTPADMPDDVIAAENEHFSKTPEEQARVFDAESEEGKPYV